MEGQRPRIVPIGSAKPRLPKPKIEPQRQKPIEPVPSGPDWAWIALALLLGFLLGLALAPHLSR